MPYDNCVSLPVQARLMFLLAVDKYSIPLVFIAKAQSTGNLGIVFVESEGHDSFISSRTIVLFQI